MNQKQNQTDRQDLTDALLDSIFCASSSTDCTGLIPTEPQNQAELEHYNELYAYLPSPPEQPEDDARQATPPVSGTRGALDRRHRVKKAAHGAAPQEPSR